MSSIRRQSRLLSLWCFLLARYALAQSDSTQLADLFPELKDLDRFSSPATSYGSRQNTTYCCLQAVNHALVYMDGQLGYRNQNDVKISGSPEDFNLSASNGQFPCTAHYVFGDYTGAPEVQGEPDPMFFTLASYSKVTVERILSRADIRVQLVTHAYCSNVCGRGWERSSSSQTGQWLSAFIGFIIPAIVFCLSIPRRRKVDIPDSLFLYKWWEIWAVKGSFMSLVGFLLAAFLAAFDILLWLSVCFACSGPMILSAAYEAFLDNRVLQFLDATLETESLTTDMRARLLFVVLAGNLDLNPKPFPLEEYSAWTGNSQTSQYLKNDVYADSPLLHLERMIFNLRSFDPIVNNCHPSQWPESPIATWRREAVTPDERKECIDSTKTRLRTMLECQYSFGNTVGAPVIFFIGAFVYALIDTLSDLGNEETSISLAFGMWWMIIPHIAILSGLLLAGNNPNTLEGVLALPSMPKEHRSYKILDVRYLRDVGILKEWKFTLAYPSRFKIAWLWMRGYSKKEWIDMILKIYDDDNKGMVLQSHRVSTDQLLPDRRADNQMDTLRAKTRFLLWPAWPWILVLSATGVLVLVPFILAFLTSYTTPTIGLACRSFTFLIYTITQILQIILLMLAYKFKSTEWNAGWLYLAWISCALVFGAAAVFAAMGGTMMQLMGVYNECRCKVSLKYWLNLDSPRVWIDIGANYSLEIREALLFWRTCGAAAVIFLGVVCYFGWWYQRRLRITFHKIVNNLEIGTRDPSWVLRNYPM